MKGVPVGIQKMEVIANGSPPLVAHEDHLCHRSPLELYEIRGVLGVF
jgi:hypothetical protein